jgi:hypothetical protein
LPPTGGSTTTGYGYVTQLDGEKICHMNQNLERTVGDERSRVGLIAAHPPYNARIW